MDFVKDWENAKSEYHKLTGEKKPRESVMKFFSTSHTGLSSTIEALTTKWAVRKDKEKNVKTYVGLLDKYRTSMDTYLKTLNKLIDEESKKTIVLPSDKKGGEVVKTNMYRGLKMLKTKLESYRAAFELQLKNLNHEQAQTSEVVKLEGTFVDAMKSGFARFRAAVKTIAATPTVEVYNREFGPGGAVKTLSDALNLYNAIADKLTTTAQQEKLKQARKWKDALEPWTSGDKKQIKSGGKDVVLKEVKAAAVMVDKCSKEYKIA